MSLSMSLTPRIDRVDKNYLINGNFDFWQRNTTFSTTGYTADRWRAVISGTASISRNSSNVPDGSLYTMRYSSSGGASFNIAQALEDNWIKALKGKTVTATVKIKRNLIYNANFILSIDTNTVANTSTGGVWTTIGSTTILNADIPTSNYLTVSVTATVPSDGTSNGLRVFMGHNGAAVNGSILDIGQVSLVIGSNAAVEFSLAGNSYAQELALCQRYYSKSFNFDVTPTANWAQWNVAIVLGTAIGNGNFLQVNWTFPVNMRANPTMTLYGGENIGNAGSIYVAGVSRTATVDRISFTGASRIANTSGVTWNLNELAVWNWTADAEL